MSNPIQNIFSKHNILGKIKNSIDYFLINMLSGGADILDEETAVKIGKGSFPQKEDLEQKGYLINEEDEKILFINSYCEASELEERYTSLIHFIPWLDCNLSCDYCPYSEINNKDWILPDAVIDNFFTYINSHFKNSQKIIVLSGGEPLLPGEKYTNTISRIFHETESRKLPVRIKTNGYYLQSYLPFFKDKRINSIHISIDFKQTPFPHSAPTEAMKDYIAKLSGSINSSLEQEIQTRVVIYINEQSIEKIHLLASFAEQSGWTENPLFSAEIVDMDNYKFCDSLKIMAPLSCSATNVLYNQILKYPEILELTHPSLSVTYSLFTDNQLPPPIFKTCPGNSRELVCAFNGNIYPCTAALRHDEVCFGTFSPEIKKYPDTLAIWEERDITTIKTCRSCSVQLGCGSGCPIRAKKKTGNYLSPDCIPVKEYMETGLSLYFDKKLISK
ncbi:MAG: radical SAM protein [Spirochaetales bacterium]|nr:radical SAM protein [Spirochaetales bacterium]